MSIKFVVAHRADPNNVGDIASNPLQYFLKPDQYQIVDVAKPDAEYYPGNVPMILGGGGLIGNTFMGNVVAEMLMSPDQRQLEKIASTKWKLVNESLRGAHVQFKKQFSTLLDNTIANLPAITSKRYVWGAGHNGDGDDITYPTELANYTKVGLRDYNAPHGYDWVPCASCMHPAFSKEYSIRNKAIWFEHKKQLIKDRAFGHEPILRVVNSGNDIAQTIELLGSAEYILTNSYHGAYWGTLLKRKVIVVGPWSSKFKFMKHSPVFIDEPQQWTEVLDRVRVYNEALDECREANQQFWESIK